MPVLAENFFKALLFIYKEELECLKQVLSNFNDEDYKKERTNFGSEFQSVQDIVEHVINSGYTYNAYFKSSYETLSFGEALSFSTVKEALLGIDALYQDTEQSVAPLLKKELSTLEATTFVTRWNVSYDVEQLFEHAIIHSARHRFQIKKMLL
jgi:uncharacterized damage-inducible protein DinB